MTRATSSKGLLPGPLAVLALFLLALSLLAPAAQAQSALPARRAGPTVYLDARAVARAVGGHLRDGGRVLTLQTAEGRLLTVFAGEAEAVLVGGPGGEREVALSAPAELNDDGWWLPLDAADVLGLEPLAGPDEEVATHWRGPDGRTWRVRLPEVAPIPLPSRAERVELAGGVAALRLFAPGGEGTRDALSLMLVDVELLALAEPSLRGRLDAALTPLRGRRALAAVATALEPTPLDLENVVLAQDGRRGAVSRGRWQTLEGDPARVTPDAPWWGVLWLPNGYRLDQPLTVGWQGVTAEMRFRR